MATYAIGDVQGCYITLQNLLEHIHFKPDCDQLWFCGDLINRGPNSAQVLRYIRDLGDNARCVLGNHDLTIFAVEAGFVSPKPGDTFNDILQASDKNTLLDFLREQPLFIEDLTLGYVMTHAGIPPAWSIPQAKECAQHAARYIQSDAFSTFLPVMMGNTPSGWNETLQEHDKIRFILNALTRLRFVDQQGNLDLLQKGPLTPQNAPFAWFYAKARKNDTLGILFGHWAALMGECPVAHIHALDTGCVWGGRLTAYRLEDGLRFSVESGE